MARNPLLILLLVVAAASAAVPVFHGDAEDKVKDDVNDNKNVNNVDGNGGNEDGNDDAVGGRRVSSSSTRCISSLEIEEIRSTN